MLPELSDQDRNWYILKGYEIAEWPSTFYTNKTVRTYKLNGNLHREDGPAFERSDGDISYYFNGSYISTEKEYQSVIQKRSVVT